MDADAQLTLPIFGSVEVLDEGGAEPCPADVPFTSAPGDDGQGVTLVGHSTKRPKRGRRMPKPGESLDPIDVMLRDFARALIATAVAVHDDMRDSGLATAPKSQRQQRKSRVQRVAFERPDVVSSAPQHDSGAAPLAPADPVVPNHLRRLET